MERLLLAKIKRVLTVISFVQNSDVLGLFNGKCLWISSKKRPDLLLREHTLLFDSYWAIIRSVVLFLTGPLLFSS